MDNKNILGGVFKYSYKDIWLELKEKIEKGEEIDLLYEMNELEDKVLHQDFEEFYFDFIDLGDGKVHTISINSAPQPHFIISTFVREYNKFVDLCAISLITNKYSVIVHPLSEDKLKLLDNWLEAKRLDYPIQTNWEWMVSTWKFAHLDSEYYDIIPKEKPNYKQMS